MHFRNFVSFSVLIVIIATVTPLSASNMQSIKGSITMRVTGEINETIQERARSLAYKEFRSELLRWMNTYAYNIDISNPMDEYHFNAFVDTCIHMAEESNDTEGDKWMYAYSIDSTQILTAIEKFNREIESVILLSWEKLSAAIQENNYNGIYEESIRTLTCTHGYYGSNPVMVPGANNGSIVDTARSVLQDFCDKMNVQSDKPILVGKSGQMISNGSRISVRIDSIPLSGMAFSAILPNETVVHSGITNDSGLVAISDFTIPFVPTGTLLRVVPNLGAVLGYKRFIPAHRFGITLNKGQEQSFIFKLDKTSYFLRYSIRSINGIDIPQKYSNDKWLHTYLTDSCALMHTTNIRVAPDLMIDVDSKILQYSHNEFKEARLKVVSVVTIKNLISKPVATHQETFEFDKEFERGFDVPLGLFFWEATQHFRRNIKGMLERF